MIDWLGNHAGTFFSGAAGFGLLAHAVTTFPTPVNKYGAWLLGVIQWTVGQRIAAANTFQGLQTITTGVTTLQKEELLK